MLKKCRGCGGLAFATDAGYGHDVCEPCVCKINMRAKAESIPINLREHGASSLVCPHCFFIHETELEGLSNGTSEEKECDRCSKVFVYETTAVVTYRSYVKEDG